MVRHRQSLPLPSEQGINEVILTCRYCERANFGSIIGKKLHEYNCYLNPRNVEEKKQLMFKCSDCSFACNRKQYLNYHKTHDCGKKHKCEICDKHYGTLRSLQLHIRNTHNPRKNLQVP
ncbi:histone-lysine N-methyltransferase MECOM-like [Leptopilina boulardi]|uniref:histone-lysine N-methyltransferase MECOM-like n=1 Tax=Leptopilina boulardi TaxID=63433 RepID=UPI0021F5F5BF|nr:histone-lysine N-methyltransferase MECOM-like [Leptopilina boulardi]